MLSRQEEFLTDLSVINSVRLFLEKIGRGLSAGRVQSVAVRIIVDREEEIRKFKPEEYWSIDAKFIPKGDRKSFSASLYSDENGKIKITNGEQADKIEADLQNAEYVITKVKNGTRKNLLHLRL